MANMVLFMRRPYHMFTKPPFRFITLVEPSMIGSRYIIPRDDPLFIWIKSR